MMNISITLIIVSFFIAILSRATFNEIKFIEALASVQDTFGLFTGGRNIIGSEDGLHLKSRGFEKTDFMLQSERKLNSIRARLTPEILNRDASISYSHDKMTLSLSSKLIFMRGSNEIRPEMAKTLQAFATVVKDLSLPIIIEGHTAKSDPQTFGVGDNWDISSQRAAAVLNFLVNSEGLNPRYFTTYGYAGTKPRHSNRTSKGRSRNNRVDLVLNFSSIDHREVSDLEPKEPSNYNFHGFDFNLQSKPGKSGDIQ